VRAPFWEWAERGESLSVRWTFEERFGRVFRFCLWFVPAAFAIGAVAEPAVPDAAGGTTVVLGAALSVLGAVVLAVLAGREGRWRFDRKAGTAFEGGARRVALPDISRVLVRRHKRKGYPNGGVVFCVHLECGPKDDAPMLLGEMDQRDAQEVGTALSRFLGVRYSEW
jgi:hypothetical protein